MKRFSLYALTITAFCCLSINTVHSQIISGNAFLFGDYVRLGLAPNAAFGTTVNAPAGMLPPGADIRNSPTCNQGKLGFVADHGKDGWTVGAPAFMGEYFLPGTPEEGWAISMDGVDYNNNRNPAFITPTGDLCTGGTSMTGTFVLFEDYPDRQVAYWEGTINNLKIMKKITLPKNKLYFITEIKLLNIGTANITDVYYMRNVDPDNEVVPAGTSAFTTSNKIEYQNPVSGNKALVSAKGLTYGSYLGLGTIDCRAKVCIGGMPGSPLSNRNPRDVYNAVAPRLSALNAANTQDCAIAIAFRLGDLVPNDTVRLAFAYILSQQDLEEALSKTAPIFNVNGISVVSGGSAINCTGTPIPINITNGEDYSWTWSPATGLNTTIGSSVIWTPQPAPITYTITGTNAVCNNATLTITMYPPTTQLAEFSSTATSSCGSKTVTFTNASLTLADPSATYKWDFGDGSPIDVSVNPVHTFPSYANYNVKLTIVTPMLTCGNDTVITHSIPVRDKPVPTMTVGATACVGTPVQFTGSATITVGTVAAHSWEFPGGIVYNTPSVTHTFSTPGVYRVKYKATSNSGCVDSVEKDITIDAIPSVDFDAANSCVGKTVSFTNNSTISVGTIAQYNWDLGNSTTSTVQNPTTTYATHGIKTVNLTATSANGCVGSKTETIDIESNPIAEFDYTKACPGTPISFTNRSTNLYGAISSYEWTFETGVTSNLVNPSYTYSLDGNYPVSLKAISAGGCESFVKVQMIPIVTVKANAGKDTLVFKDSPFQLHGDGGLMYTWTPSIFLNSATVRHPVGSIKNDQEFQVEVIDERGCKGSDVVNVRVFVDDDIYVPAGFTPNNDGKNDLFRVIAPPGTVYLFEVYNRWGQRVFATQNQQQGWDGKIGTQMQASGVYVWHLKAKTRKGQLVEKKGTMTMIW